MGSSQVVSQTQSPVPVSSLCSHTLPLSIPAVVTGVSCFSNDKIPLKPNFALSASLMPLPMQENP